MTEPEVKEEEAKNTIPPIKYATFNARIFASAIDILLIMLVAVPVTHWLIAKVLVPIDINDIAPLLRNPETSNDFLKFLHGFWNIAKEKHILQQALFENLLDIIFIAAYTIPFWFRYSATPGKMLFGMQIQDINTNTPLTHKQAVLRFFCYIVSFLPFSLGFLWIFFNKKHRGFHDILANTIVIIKPMRNAGKHQKTTQ